jgi:hypothetical protein
MTINLIPTFDQESLEETYAQLKENGYTGVRYTPEGHKALLIEIPHIVTKAIRNFISQNVTKMDAISYMEHLLYKDKQIPNKLALSADASFANFQFILRHDRIDLKIYKNQLQKYPEAFKLLQSAHDMYTIINIAFEHAEKILITLSTRDAP